MFSQGGLQKEEAEKSYLNLNAEQNSEVTQCAEKLEFVPRQGVETLVNYSVVTLEWPFPRKREKLN